MLKEMSIETVQRTAFGGAKKYYNWAVTFYYGDRILSEIPMTVAVSSDELADIQDDIYTYNTLRMRGNKEDIQYCKALLHYFKTINDSKCFVEKEYVKESYMGLIGKHTVESIMMDAIDNNACKVAWLETTLNESNNCKLYKNKYYVTRNMIKVLIGNMVEKMQDWQLNNFEKQFKIDLTKKKSIKMLSDYVFDTFISNNLDINCKELQFITDCLKAYKHSTVF